MIAWGGNIYYTVAYSVCTVPSITLYKAPAQGSLEFSLKREAGEESCGTGEEWGSFPYYGSSDILFTSKTA